MSYLQAITCSLLLLACQSSVKDNEGSLAINTSHLDHLYQEINLPTKDTFAIIHIYSEYPGYDWIGDSDEGITCVDDVARAIIFYLRNYHYSGEIESLKKGKQLLRFLFFMQSENGYFYNFIFPDYTINRTGITSRAEPNWWSWRALWALGEAIDLLDPNTTDHDRMLSARNRLLDAIISDFEPVMIDSLITVDGLEIPQWLPGTTASDQAALMVLGLGYVQKNAGPEINPILQSLLSGMQKMQIQNEKKFPHGAFLSWQNIWHAYGNSQSYALLKTSRITNNPNLVLPAITEIKYFFPEAFIDNQISHFRVTKSNQSLVLNDRTSYPQIAYNIRPVIWACLEAEKITGEIEYLQMAQKVSRWFAGENPAGMAMYNARTGRCFDGINGMNDVNRNAGAESTIEALLSLQELYYFDNN